MLLVWPLQLTHSRYWCLSSEDTQAQDAGARVCGPTWVLGTGLWVTRASWPDLQELLKDLGPRILARL